MNIDEMRSRKPGDVILSAAGLIPFIVTEIVHGHVWGNFSETMIQGECCRVCGYMRRRDRLNKPCEGPKEISLRNEQVQ